MNVVKVISPVHRPPLEIIPVARLALLCNGCVTFDINYGAIMHKKIVFVRHKATYSLCFLLLSETFTSSLCVSAARQNQGRTSMSQQETGHTEQSGCSVGGVILYEDITGWQVG
jgi:hypothetical protein